MNFKKIVPVLESGNIQRDVAWYEKHLGFVKIFGDNMYVGLMRNGFEIHLQWHEGSEQDPLNGGAVSKIFVDDIQAIFEEYIERGTVNQDKLHRNTPWATHEFGFYDLNGNAIFIVQNL